MSEVRRVYINYAAQVTDQSVQRLFAAIQDRLRTDAGAFTLLVSSPGGMVRAGIAAYNYLKGIPIEVATHSYGQTDSVAVVVFCAGSVRSCSPNARFLIHGIGFNAQANERFDERALGERLVGLKNDRQTVSKIISENSKRSLEEVEQDMFAGVVWNPEQAVSYGLVHKIEEKLFERGADIISIMD